MLFSVTIFTIICLGGSRKLTCQTKPKHCHWCLLIKTMKRSNMEQQIIQLFLTLSGRTWDLFNMYSSCQGVLSWHYGHFGLNNDFLVEGGALLSFVGCLADPWPLSKRCQKHPWPQVTTTKNVSRCWQISSRGKITPGWESLFYIIL